MLMVWALLLLWGLNVFVAGAFDAWVALVLAEPLDFVFGPLLVSAGGVALMTLSIAECVGVS